MALALNQPPCLTAHVADILRNVLARSADAAAEAALAQLRDEGPVGVTLHVDEPSESTTDTADAAAAIEFAVTEAESSDAGEPAEGDDDAEDGAPADGAPADGADRSMDEPEAAQEESADVEGTVADSEAIKDGSAAEEAGNTIPAIEVESAATVETAGEETEGVDATVEPREVEPREVTLAEETQA